VLFPLREQQSNCAIASAGPTTTMVRSQLKFQFILASLARCCCRCC